jgi:acetyltransferase-like isoleucine patch superfamily enzyme
MGVVLAAVGLFLSGLADLEFELIGHLRLNPVRRLQLRFLHVPHGKNIYLGKQIMIRNRGNLSFGDNCALGSYARVWNYSPIEIGDYFLSAGALTLNSGGHDPLTLENRSSPIHIGDRVWCGINVTILQGVTIGDDVIVGAGSLVIEDVPSNTIVGGVPARRIRSLDRTAEASQRASDYMTIATGGAPASTPVIFAPDEEK